MLADSEGDLVTAARLADQAVELDEAAIKAGGQGAHFLLSAFRSATEHLEKTLGTEHPESRAARQLAASVSLGGIHANRQ